MSRKYDAKTTTFSPDGRLLQVEYAMEAINKAGAAIGILTTEGLILATEKQDVSSLLEKSKTSEKIYSLDTHVFCVVSGMTADANYLIDYARLASQRFYYAYRTKMPIHQLINKICDLKQTYTQIGGQRPFGTAFLFAGYDKNHKFQLYSSDPSGNYSDYKATAIGNNNLAANSFLKQEYNDNLTLEQGTDLAIKSLVKTMDTATPSANKIELVQITVDQNGKVHGVTLKEDQVNQLLTKNNLQEVKKE